QTEDVRRETEDVRREMEGARRAAQNEARETQDEMRKTQACLARSTSRFASALEPRSRSSLILVTEPPLRTRPLTPRAPQALGGRGGPRREHSPPRPFVLHSATLTARSLPPHSPIPSCHQRSFAPCAASSAHGASARRGFALPPRSPARGS